VVLLLDARAEILGPRARSGVFGVVPIVSHPVAWIAAVAPAGRGRAREGPPPAGRDFEGTAQRASRA
jgi:hypothetical protein